jgi:hypothetical protein
MARDAKQSDVWDFEVEQEQIIHQGRALPYFGNFRRDTKECLGITTEAYGIIQNKTLVDAAEQALDDRKLSGFERKIMVAGDGQQMYADFTFKNKALATKVGDRFGYVLRLRNSFDRTLRASFELGFLRLVCTNGAATIQKEFACTRKHSTNVDIRFVGTAVDHAFEAGARALEVYNELAEMKITDKQGVNILANLENKGVLSGTLNDNIRNVWLSPTRKEDKARNVYNLYNAATDYLTHVVQPERYVYANRVTGELLNALSGSIRVPDRFKALILDAPKAATANN